MLKIHALYEYGENFRPHGSAFIRLLLPLTHVSNKQFFTVTQGRFYSKADVVIIERMWGPQTTLSEVEELVSHVRKDKALLIYTLDDNLLDLNLPGIAQPHFSPEKIAIVRYLTRQADGVIVSTEALKDRLSRLNPAIFVVPNALDEKLLDEVKVPIQPDSTGVRRKVIGYMGTFTHDADLMMILQPMREILSKNRGKVEFQLIGGVGDAAVLRCFDELPLKVLNVGGQSDYPNFMRWMGENLRWDLGIAPLEDTAFSRCKSDIKYLDYGSQAIAGIYSRVPAYQNTVRHLETGYLAENTVESWREAFDLLLNDDSLRIKMAENARGDVISNRTLKQCAKNWREAIFSILHKSC